MDAALFTWYFEWQISVITEGFEVLFQETAAFPSIILSILSLEQGHHVQPDILQGCGRKNSQFP